MDKFVLEKIKKEGVSLNSFLNEKLLETSKLLDIQPINITFLKHTKEMISKKISPQLIIVGHENSNEIKENLIHINCLDEKLLKDFVEKL